MTTIGGAGDPSLPDGTRPEAASIPRVALWKGRDLSAVLPELIGVDFSAIVPVKPSEEIRNQAATKIQALMKGVATRKSVRATKKIAQQIFKSEYTSVYDKSIFKNGLPEAQHSPASLDFPTLRAQKKRNSKLHKKLLSKRIAHTLKLNGYVPIDGKAYPLAGMYDNYTVPMIHGSFSHFASLPSSTVRSSTKKFVSDTFTTAALNIKPAVKTEAELRATVNNEVDRVYTLLQDPDYKGVIQISTGTNRHSTMTLIQGNTIICANTGEGAVKGNTGTNVYHLPKRADLTKDVLRKMMYSKMQNPRLAFTEQKMLKMLKLELVHHESLPSQTSQTCSYDNVANALQALLALDHINQDPSTSRSQLSKEQWAEGFESTRATFKSWEKADQHTAVRQLVIEVDEMLKEEPPDLDLALTLMNHVKKQWKGDVSVSKLLDQVYGKAVNLFIAKEHNYTDSSDDVTMMTEILLNLHETPVALEHIDASALSHAKTALFTHVDSYGRPFTHYFAKSILVTDNPVRFKMMAEMGLDVNQRDTQGNTVLHRPPIGEETLKVLLEVLGDVNAANNKGETPLMKFMAAGSAACHTATLLLEKGGDPQLQDNEGNTLFHFVSDPKFLKPLLRKEPSLMMTLVNHKGESPVDTLISGLKGIDLTYLKTEIKNDRQSQIILKKMNDIYDLCQTHGGVSILPSTITKLELIAEGASAAKAALLALVVKLKEAVAISRLELMDAIDEDMTTFRPIDADEALSVGAPTPQSEVTVVTPPPPTPSPEHRAVPPPLPPSTTSPEHRAVPPPLPPARVSVAKPSVVTPPPRGMGSSIQSHVIAMNVRLTKEYDFSPDTNDLEHLTEALVAIYQNPDLLTSVDSTALANAQKALFAHVDHRGKPFIHQLIRLPILAENPERLQLFIKMGLDIHARDDKGNTVLHAPPISEEVLSVLCDALADVNSQNTLGETPLMKFVQAGSVSRYTAAFLVTKGADTNLQDKAGNTILHHLKEASYLKPLLEKTAAIEGARVNKAGESPIDVLLSKLSRLELHFLKSTQVGLQQNEKLFKKIYGLLELNLSLGALSILPSTIENLQNIATGASAEREHLEALITQLSSYVA